MSFFFIRIYDFFRKNRVVFFLVFFTISAIFIYYASKINLEEDISKATPGSDNELTQIVKKLNTADKLFINIYLTDTGSAAEPDKLSLFADELVDSLGNENFSPFIKGIAGKINDSLVSNVMDVLYNNLPIFLNKSDYKKIDSLISREAVEGSIKRNYKTLLSPGSFVFKKFIKRDPVGISYLAFNKLKQLQFDDSYEIINDYIFTKDKKHLLLFINPAYPSNKTNENSQFVKRLDRLFLYLNDKSNNIVCAEYFGAVTVAAGNAMQIKKDIMLSVIVSLLIILLFVAWYFKKWLIPFISFLPAVFGGALALAIIYLFKTNISVIALAIGSVLLGIIVDYALYIFCTYKAKKSYKDVLADMSLTIVLCSITTATAFFSMLFVNSEVLRDLGLFAGLSVLGAAVFSLIFLPHFVNWKKQDSEALPKLTVIDRISKYPYESNKILVLLICLITVLFLVFPQDINFEKDMYKMNFLTEKSKKAEKNLNMFNDIAVRSVYVISTGKTLDQALLNNSEVDKTIKKLYQQKIIKKYSTISSIIIPDSLQKDRIKIWNEYWTSGKKEKLINDIISNGKNVGFKTTAFSEFYSLLEKQFSTVKINDSKKIISVFLSDRIIENSEQSMIVTLAKVNNDDRDKVFNAFKGKKNVYVFDKQKITANFVSNIETDFNILVNLCLIFVTLLLIISFGRIEIGAIAATPMFVSWLITLGIMGVFGLKFNIINIIISTFIFGLGVDYSILMIRGLLLEYKFGRKEITSYKTAIFLSAFTTIVGVGVLILAKHPALNSIALIAIIGLLTVVIVSYAIEPVLFSYLIKKKSMKRRVPMTFVDMIFTCIAFTIFIFGCVSMNILFVLMLIIPIRKKAKKLIMHHVMSGFCWFEIYFMFNVKKRIVNPRHENFRKPAMIIANHQSHIDLLLMLMLHPKMIVITNKWVWNNPVYALVIRYLDFYNISDGYENVLSELKEKISEGYSILVFPEGSRSETDSINRFHKGAFLMAEELQLDILPIIMHGVGDCMSKGENFLKSGCITLKICDRIKFEDRSWGEDYHIRTKNMLKFFREEYAVMSKEYGTAHYYKRKLIRNYIYKGPILEWYLKVKLRLERNYELFNSLVPENAKITDIGCGYGFLPYMLNFLSEKRNITGIDYDAGKIDVAANCISKNNNVAFYCADALSYDLPASDVFILSDVLHYLNNENQVQLINKCINSLNEMGKIIIRDGDRNLKKRHRGTLYTEFFSTKFGFNKATNKLHYISSDEISDIVSRHGIQLEIIDNTKLTSNLIYIIKK